MKRAIISGLRRIFEIAAKEVIADAVKEIKQDVLASQTLSPLSTHYIPWTKPALSPRSVATILNEIVIKRRCSVLECGGGISTIYIARYFKHSLSSAHLYTVEHDTEWCSVLQEMLGREGLSEYVTFIRAKLIPAPTTMTVGGVWYDPEPIAQALEGIKLDLLLIDGPPASPQDPFRRYAALHFLSQYITEDSSIILDDASRRGEREILKRWQQEYGYEFEIVGDLGIASKDKKYKIYG